MKWKNAAFVALDSIRINCNQKKIFFLHIPKCGGISLRNAIASTYGLTQLVVPNSINFLDAGSAGYAATKRGGDIYEFRDVLLAYYLSIPRSRFISGHFPLYGAGIGPLSKDWNIITMLREPKSKWISSYYYNRYFENPEHVWRESDVTYTKRIDMDVGEFLTTEQAMEYGCDFIRQVVKIDKMDDAYKEDVIKEAIERLEAISLVGILEQTETFIKAFECYFNVRLNMRHTNKNPAKNSTKSKLSPFQRKQIMELCEPNHRIYEHFSKRL